MAETRRLTLPLLDGAQAQKHVTMNEALTRLDALTAPGVISRSMAAPPPTALDGDAYIVSDGAADAWAGRDGLVAFADNLGWSFAAPEPGRRLWVSDERLEVVHDGERWVAAVGATEAGAGTMLHTQLIDHAVGAGPVSTTAPVIPDKAIVLGVTGRVIAALSGPGLTTWRLGVAGGADRYGRGLGAGLNAYVEGVTGAPVTYYAPTPLTLEAEGGAFAKGVVRLCVHYLALTPPRAV
ncbi:MAG: hypothetical protein CVT86_02555 [Alphaproteobacteria bacterium HGW-Alphaproteobacteria-8]|jgi:hypothetical protein|nr:MAG: hypothetical protein CVT86_02555 [Alphaproteobacteria bacterium HGW-Alphaproteobacteria-8]